MSTRIKKNSRERTRARSWRLAARNQGKQNSLDFPLSASLQYSRHTRSDGISGAVRTAGNSAPARIAAGNGSPLSTGQGVGDYYGGSPPSPRAGALRPAIRAREAKGRGEQIGRTSPSCGVFLILGIGPADLTVNRWKRAGGVPRSRWCTALLTPTPLPHRRGVGVRGEAPGSGSLGRPA